MAWNIEHATLPTNLPTYLPTYLHIFRRDDTMLRHTLARSAWRTPRQAAARASRAFSASPQRPAEVELTIGQSQMSGGEDTASGHVLTGL